MAVRRQESLPASGRSGGEIHGGQPHLLLGYPAAVDARVPGLDDHLAEQEVRDVAHVAA